jgi:hypothetical protein
VGIELQDVAKQSTIMHGLIDHQGRRGSVERFFVERLSPWTDFSEERMSSWREALCGEILQGETLSMERTAEEREASWRERLHGETLSVEKPLQGEMIFKERMSLWRDSSRREELRGEHGQL